ncbi:sulfite exporter TauE/SafE family protein [Legionella fallonii]|uniref:Probable membrane transporter protein n=1 Tax=Legionella fallonii LLAP-10 TaxID=1212491 RepID=A0A098GBS1_9GAMM|nr:sulfite exporter TauE/SafE family protein [Legionella fallonii]CEG58931.1 conserved membrane protein of unknown function [Legionella fallonii LLAP-10]
MIVDLLFHGVIYAVIGVFAGFMAGILGIGGGIIVVPGLAFLFQINHSIPESSIMHVATGTSLAVITCTAQASLRAHHTMGEVLWSVFYRLLPGVILGAISGAVLAAFVSTYWLKIIFAVFLLCVACKMLFDKQAERPQKAPKPWLDRLVSYFIGLKSGLLGVGGGILTIPYLTYCGVPIRKIPAISNLCGITVASVGTIIFIITGWHAMATVPYSTGYIYWPAVFWIAIPSSLTAPFGARLNYVLPVKQLRYVFIMLLLLTAIKMLF